MIPCNGKHETKWWMRILCVFGLHWHGRRDGGMMGDAAQCHVCGMDRYGPALFVWNEEEEKEEKLL